MVSLRVIEGGEPAWLAALRADAAAHGQKRAGQRIGKGASTVSQVLAGKYKGNIDGIRRACEGVYFASTVACPGFDFEIGADRCQQIQRRREMPTTAELARCWRACRAGCRHFRNRSEGETGEC